MGQSQGSIQPLPQSVDGVGPVTPDGRYLVFAAKRNDVLSDRSTMFSKTCDRWVMCVCDLFSPKRDVREVAGSVTWIQKGSRGIDREWTQFHAVDPPPIDSEAATNGTPAQRWRAILVSRVVMDAESDHLIATVEYCSRSSESGEILVNYSKPAVPMFLSSCRKFICCECGSGRLNLAAVRGSTCGNVLPSDCVRFTKYHHRPVKTFRPDQPEWKTGCSPALLTSAPFVCPDYRTPGADGSPVNVFMHLTSLVPTADETHLPVACYPKLWVSRLPTYAEKGVPLDKIALRASLEKTTPPWNSNRVMFMDNELTLVWSIEESRLFPNPENVSEAYTLYLQCYRHYQASPKGACCQPTVCFGLLAYQVRVSGKAAIAPSLKYCAVHHEGYICFHDMRSGAEVAVESRSSRKVPLKGGYVDMFFASDNTLCVKDIANRVFALEVPRDIQTTREQLKVLLVDEQRLLPLDVFELLEQFALEWW